MAKSGLRVDHLVAHAQRIRDQAPVARLDRKQSFARMHDHPRERDAADRLHRLADHRIRLDCHVAVGEEEIRIVEKYPVNRIRIDESFDLDGAGGLQPDILQLVIGDHDILVPGYFIALDEFGTFDGS